MDGYQLMFVSQKIMTSSNLPNNPVQKNIIKLIHLPQKRGSTRKGKGDCQDQIAAPTPQENILRAIEGFEKYSRSQKFWNRQKHSKAKYKATKDFFLTKLARYPKYELETTKANIETNLELGKYLIGLGVLVTLTVTKSFSDNMKVAGLTVGIVVLASAIIYQLLAAQLMRLNWIKVATARKGSS